MQDGKRIFRNLARDPDISGNSILYQQRWCPPYSAFNVLPSEETDWNSSELSPDMSSMFRDIISLYETGRYDASDIPNMCRRIILWSWTAQVNLNATLVAQEVTTLALGSDWEDKTQRRLLQARLQMKSLNEDIHTNMKALGIGTHTSATKPYEDEDWRSLQSTIDAVEQRIDLVYESYTQMASIHESKTANVQAIRVRHLTILATIFIPVSLIAGIFSMGGKFAAGSSMFWVFWVVSILFVAILLLFIFLRFFQPLLRKILQMHRIVLSTV